jgi:hypothetical protein
MFVIWMHTGIGTTVVRWCAARRWPVLFSAAPPSVRVRASGPLPSAVEQNVLPGDDRPVAERRVRAAGPCSRWGMLIVMLRHGCIGGDKRVRRVDVYVVDVDAEAV